MAARSPPAWRRPGLPHGFTGPAFTWAFTAFTGRITAAPSPPPEDVAAPFGFYTILIVNYAKGGRCGPWLLNKMFYYWALHASEMKRVLDLFKAPDKLRNDNLLKKNKKNIKSILKWWTFLGNVFLDAKPFGEPVYPSLSNHILFCLLLNKTDLHRKHIKHFIQFLERFPA